MKMEIFRPRTMRRTACEASIRGWEYLFILETVARDGDIFSRPWISFDFDGADRRRGKAGGGGVTFDMHLS